MDTYGIAFTAGEWAKIIAALNFKIKSAENLGLASYVEEEEYIKRKINIRLNELTQK